MDPEAPVDVLVVEDDPDLNEMVGAYVELSGHPWRSALDGGAALAEVRARRPGMVLLDLMLPVLDGFEVCRQLRADASTRDLPVVIVSALDDEGARQRAREFGVADYVTKPFDPERLIDVIRRTLHQAAT